MLENRHTRRKFLAGITGLALAGGVIALDRRINSSFDQGKERPYDGMLRDRAVYDVTIHPYYDKRDDRTYQPIFRVMPSIAAAELTDEELENKGYTRSGVYQGVKVYGDTGNQGRTLKSMYEGRVQYQGWLKLEEGVFVSDNFVEYKGKIKKSNR